MTADTGWYDHTQQQEYYYPQSPQPQYYYEQQPPQQYYWTPEPEPYPQQYAQQQYQPPYEQQQYAQPYEVGYEYPAYQATSTMTAVLDELTPQDLAYLQYQDSAVAEEPSPYQEEPEDLLEDPQPLDDLDDLDDNPELPERPLAALPEARPGGRAAARAAQKRTSRRRSAVLTIAVPSVAVLGIAGAAAATLAPGSSASGHSNATASDANSTLTAADQKAQALAAQEAKASAEQASRDHARQALALRTAAAKKKAAETPKVVLPITQHVGLSALFGQAGTHWMSLHTGIDFPVSTGTSVHAVTDGTVSTKWNAYYGNMLILTAPDGTQTWYCHLSAYKVRSGSVKAGDVIAYSGDTGNSTGPHLHFEVHPDGGAAIDPLPWLLAHGLDPR
ncbi:MULTISPECIES: M23 family metallopeptidase [Streptacidiphilus]|uniref:M23 family metallopeptidase n=1 Tax=Streptacidiphilus cavernicola TaxID=3342716 RepID=A0ABV6USI3_9ACTN|nr:M23 family metallopeptidase [Streptacidiphilus jeojiense]